MYTRMRFGHCSIHSTKRDLYYTARVSIGKPNREYPAEIGILGQSVIDTALASAVSSTIEVSFHWNSSSNKVFLLLLIENSEPTYSRKDQNFSLRI